MTDTATHQLIPNIENSRIEGTNLCVVAKESLETLVGCINGLTKTSEDIAQSLRTLTRILNKQDSANKDLATKLDTLNLNITFISCRSLKFLLVRYFISVEMIIKVL